MSHQQKTLWTKDFTSIAIATILTAVGGEAMNLPISLLVFDETGSTFLSALVLICRSEERRVGKECRSRWSPYH